MVTQGHIRRHWNWWLTIAWLFTRITHIMNVFRFTGNVVSIVIDMFLQMNIWTFFCIFQYITFAATNFYVLILMNAFCYWTVEKRYRRHRLAILCSLVNIKGVNWLDEITFAGDFAIYVVLMYVNHLLITLHLYTGSIIITNWTTRIYKFWFFLCNLKLYVHNCRRLMFQSCVLYINIRLYICKSYVG